jgi:uncharacterized membrane protein (DUF441 family)
MSALSKRIDDFKNEIKKSKKYLDKLRKIPIPENIREQKKVTNKLAIQMLPGLALIQPDDWNTRAMPVAAIFKQLEDFEIHVTQALAPSDTSIIISAANHYLRIAEYVLGHVGEVTIIIVSVLELTLKELDKKYPTFQDKGNAFGVAMLKLINFLSDKEKVQDAAASLLMFLEENEGVAEVLVGVLLASGIAFLNSLQQHNLEKMLEPIDDAMVLAQGRMTNKAFPQGSGRVRRTRRHRSR